MTYLNIFKKPVIPGIILPAFFSAAIFFSCRKNNESTHENIFNAPAAKEWFYATFKKTSEYATAAAAGKQLPDWKTGRYKKTGNMEMVEYDLVQQKKTALVAPTGNRFEDKRIAEAAVNRALFVKKDNETKLFIIQFIPGADYAKANSYDVSKNGFTGPDKNFTGKLLVKNWNNELVNGYNIANGKKESVIKKIAKENPASRTDINDGCLYSYFAWYEQDCTIVPIGDNVAIENCSEWQLIWESITETYCPANPSECALLGLDQEACMCQMLGMGCGGEGEDECSITGQNNLNELSNSGVVSNETFSITTVANTATTRTKEYQWIILKGLGWCLMSFETGVHVKNNNTNPSLQWKWQSLQHDEIDLIGVVVGGGIDHTLKKATPTVGQYNAIMDIDFKVKYSIVCSGFPMSNSLVYNSKKNFSIDD